MCPLHSFNLAEKLLLFNNGIGVIQLPFLVFVDIRKAFPVVISHVCSVCLFYLFDVDRCVSSPSNITVAVFDTASQMLGCGKKTAWSVWNSESMSGLTDVFHDLLDDPSRLTMESFEMKMIEKFVVLQYSKRCGVASVNDAGCILFTMNLKGLNAIPPIKNALFQHVLRSLLQASFIWLNCLNTSI